MISQMRFDVFAYVCVCAPAPQILFGGRFLSGAADPIAPFCQFDSLDSDTGANPIAPMPDIALWGNRCGAKFYESRGYKSQLQVTGSLHKDNMCCCGA